MISNINPYRKKKSKATKTTLLRRTPQQMESDRVFISKYYTRGYSYRDITKILNDELIKNDSGYVLTEASVYNEIKIILMEWKRERFESIEEYIQIELRKLDKIEMELWEAWEMSKTGKRKVKIRGGEMDTATENASAKGGKIQNRVTESSAGDPKFLDLLLSVQEKRARLLGYDVPMRVAFDKPLEVAATDVDWTLMPDDLVMKMADAIQNQKAEFAKKKVIDSAEGYSDFQTVEETQETVPVDNDLSF